MITNIINNVEIHSVSSYLPESIFSMHSLIGEYPEKEIEQIIKATGIEEVRIANKNVTSLDLCIRAANEVLNDFDMDKIDGVVYVSQTRDFILPLSSFIIQDKLGLKKSTICYDIPLGCSGYVYGLFQAAILINSGFCNNVIVLAGDTTSRIINKQDKAVKMVFGDAGSATIVKKGNTSMAFSFYSDGSGFDKLIIPSGGFRKPQSDETNKVLIDDDGNGRSENDLFMDGLSIFNFAIKDVPNHINSLLERLELDKQSVDIYAFHQANELIVNYIAKKLKVDKSKVPCNVKYYGNTGPSSIPLLFSDLYGNRIDLDRNTLSNVLLCGFGVGLSIASALINLNNTIFYKPINCK
jgi:3-oxoacyl-[acyl-carrier-protein] synthase-3